MNLFCLLHSQDLLLTRLRKCLGAIVDGVQVEYYFTLKSLLNQLGDPACFAGTVLMVGGDSQMLDLLLAHREVLLGVPMVLLIDDEKESNVAKGHLLRSRFMTGLASDPEPIKQVLCNLLRMQKQKNLIAAF